MKLERRIQDMKTQDIEILEYRTIEQKNVRT